MDDGGDALPEAAERRLASGSFSSSLTPAELAACLDLGLEPVGLVQGFCVMSWGALAQTSSFLAGGLGGAPYRPGPGGSGDYSEVYRCPHGFVSNDHRTWGQNFEQSWVEGAWAQGFGSAYQRLSDEAAAAGAHGVIGIVDSSRHLADMHITEFHILGTAVVVDGGSPPPGGRPWTTYLAGPRLAKLIEAGLMPVSVAASMASIRIWAYCMTEYLMEGRNFTWGGYGAQEVDQVSRAHTSARQLVRARVRAQIGDDALHGARLTFAGHELGEGDSVVECTLRGTRVRRWKDFDPMAAPIPTVHLS